MNFTFAKVLTDELELVETIYQEGLQIWWDDLASLRECLQDDKSLHLMPAVVVMAYKYIDADHKLTIDMASLFKTLYFANLIHHQVGDEKEGQDHNQALQFTILIGDYIFGRILKLLLKIGAVQVLDNLAMMICRINEGLVMQYKLGADRLEVIKRGNAAIYETAFVTAARLKGLAPEAIELYGRLGFQIGMAMEMLIAGIHEGLQPHIEESLDLLKQFNDLYGFHDNGLPDLLQDMASENDHAGMMSVGCQ